MSMLSQLSRWFSPPIFEGDEQKTSRARLLIAVTTSVSIFVLFAFLGALVGGNASKITMGLTLTLFFLVLVCHYLVFLGFIKIVGVLLLGMGYAFITAAILSIGTIRAPATAAYLFFIIVSGALFEKKGVWFSVLASAFALAVLIAIENLGWLGEPNLRVTVTQWIIYTSIFGMTGSMSLLSSQLTRESLQKSHIEIAERKQAEEKYRQLLAELDERVQERTAALQASNKALETASRLKSEFLASMSHELRTPLTGILGLSEALQQHIYGEISPKQEKAIKNIESSGAHLLDLINDILDLSKIEAGELSLQTSLVSVEDLCRASLSLTRGMANKKNIQIQYLNTLSSNFIEADSRRIKQILVNLLSNAIKFTKNGGQAGLQVNETLEDSTVEFTVWDTGIGIKPEDLNKLFQPFIQLDGSLSRQHEGTGLGLALAKRLAELHHGAIQVESTPDMGSRFTLSLPKSSGQHTPQFL